MSGVTTWLLLEALDTGPASGVGCLTGEAVLPEQVQAQGTESGDLDSQPDAWKGLLRDGIWEEALRSSGNLNRRYAEDPAKSVADFAHKEMAATLADVAQWLERKPPAPKGHRFNSQSRAHTRVAGLIPSPSLGGGGEPGFSLKTAQGSMITVTNRFTRLPVASQNSAPINRFRERPQDCSWGSPASVPDFAKSGGGLLHNPQNLLIFKKVFLIEVTLVNKII